MTSKARRLWSMFVPLTLGLVLALALAVFASHSVSATEPAQEPDAPETPAPSPILRADGTIDVGPILRSRDLALDEASLAGVQSQLSELQARGALQAGYGVGDSRIFAGLDNFNGFYFLTTYDVRLISDTVEVWVQSDLSYPSPVHPDRDDPDYVNEDRIVELATAFEDVIRPTDVNYFGAYDTLTGTQSTFQDVVPSLELPEDYFETDDGQRTIILVQNVRDGNFYDPANNPAYIAGFFSPTFEDWADRNIITIDSKQWNSRVGAPSYLYESVTVHELQHLINADYDGDEESWANEARSEFSEFIAGYRPTPQSHRTTWSDYPENSLTIWGDQDDDPDQTFEILADYQEAYWFLLYLTGQLADDGAAGLTVEQAVQLVAETTQDGENGIASLDDMLADAGASFTVAEVWEDFRTDMTVGGTSDATGWGDYVSTYNTTSGLANAQLDLGRLRRNLDFEGYDTPGAPPHGSDYLEIGWSPDIVLNPTLNFTGEVAIPTGWDPTPAAGIGVTPTGSVSGDVLHSGHSNLTDNFVIFETSVPTSGDQTLAFDTLYNIEGTWDYGFVQVTTDTAGATGFGSLDLPGTVTATAGGAHPIIAANVPGYSGYSGGWLHVEHDLGAYAGQDILLAFRYATDWATAGHVGDIAPGWYIDNVSLGDSDLYTDTLPADAQSIWQARDNQYDVDVDFVTYADGNGDAINNVYPMTVSDAGNGTVTGSFDMTPMLADTGFNEPDERAVGIISGIAPTADSDLIGAPTEYVSYTLSGLPASINTSRLRTRGSAAGSSLLGPAVYPGDAFSVTVTLDNFGRNDDLQTVADTTASVAVPIPAHTTISNTGPYAYTPDLSTVDPTLPVEPGVYWLGTVSETVDLAFTLQADMPLTTGLYVTPTAHVANDSTFIGASQTFTDAGTPVEIESPLAFSAASAPTTPVPANRPVPFEFTLVNTDDAARDVDFTFTVPPDTSLHSISFGSTPLAPADVQETANGQVQVTLSVPPFLSSGEATQVTVELLPDEGYSGDTLSLAPTLYQPDSNIPYHEFEAGEATAHLLTHVQNLPLIRRD